MQSNVGGNGYYGGSSFLNGTDEYGHNVVSYDGGATWSNLGSEISFVGGSSQFGQTINALGWALDGTAANVYLAQLMAGVANGNIIDGLKAGQVLGYLGTAIGVVGAIEHYRNYYQSVQNGDPNYYELAHAGYDTIGIFVKLSPTGVVLFVVGDRLMDAAGNYYD